MPVAQSAEVGQSALDAHPAPVIQPAPVGQSAPVAQLLSVGQLDLVGQLDPLGQLHVVVQPELVAQLELVGQNAEDTHSAQLGQVLPWQLPPVGQLALLVRQMLPDGQFEPVGQSDAVGQTEPVGFQMVVTCILLPLLVPSAFMPLDNASMIINESSIIHSLIIAPPMLIKTLSVFLIKMQECVVLTLCHYNGYRMLLLICII